MKSSREHVKSVLFSPCPLRGSVFMYIDTIPALNTNPMTFGIRNLFTFVSFNILLVRLFLRFEDVHVSRVYPIGVW